MTALSRTALESEISSLIADNTSGNITPADVRQVQNDTADSCFNLVTDNFGSIPSGAIQCTTISASGDITLNNGFALKTDTTTAHAFTIEGYETTTSAYVTIATLTNGTTATLAINPSTNGACTIDNSTIGGSVPAAGTFTTLQANTSLTLASGTALQTDTTTAHTLFISGYSTTNAAYEPLATVTNGTIPTLALASSATGTVSIKDVVRKDCVVSTSTLTKTSDTTLALVPGLSVALTAGGTYRISVHLEGTGANSGGLKAVLATADTLTLTSGLLRGRNRNGTADNASTLITALGSDFSNATTAYTDVTLEGTIVVNAAGTLEVQVAQATSNATSSTVTQGSWLEVKRLS